MSFTLNDVRRGVEPRAPRVVLYGPMGVGKTTACANMRGAIVLPTEEGLGTLDVPHFPQLQTYADVVDAITMLVAEDHGFLTPVLDSVSSLEAIVWAEVCRRNKWDSIEAPGFGRGYVEADLLWAELLQGFDALRDRGMMVVLIGHSASTKHRDPGTGEEFDRHELALHKRARGMVTKWADVVAFAHWRVMTREVDAGFGKKATKPVATDQRMIGLQERPAYDAKNRYGLPTTMPLDAAQFTAALDAAFTPAASAAGTCDTTDTTTTEG